MNQRLLSFERQMTEKSSEELFVMFDVQQSLLHETKAGNAEFRRDRRQPKPAKDLRAGQGTVLHLSIFLFGLDRGLSTQGFPGKFVQTH
jgi:hypothetical protein